MSDLVKFRRVQVARFPTRITSLDHVMKSIDIYSMEPEEVMVEAANANELKWLRSLLDGHDVKVRDRAMISAARDGYTRAVRVLMLEITGAQTGELDYKSINLLTNAATEAAASGHLDVVQLLWLELQADGKCSDHNLVWGALVAASARGHLDVVKFAALFVRGTPCWSLRDLWKALTIAAKDGHIKVAEFLLEPGRYDWDYSWELTLAVDRGQGTLAELIYAVCPLDDRRCFISKFAVDGKLEAIMCLYSKGHKGSELVEDTFVQAAGNGYTKIVTFLIRSGPISPETFDLAFESAATLSDASTLKFLYNEHRVSRTSLVAAFECTRSAAAVEFILSNENISSGSVVMAFKNAARWGDDRLKMFNCYAGGAKSREMSLTKWSQKLRWNVSRKL